jgi:superfamily I DNA/RNA helicase
MMHPQVPVKLCACKRIFKDFVAKKNDAYRNILAITFTNKAVHEMKSRIVEVYPNLQKTISKSAGINAGFS